MTRAIFTIGHSARSLAHVTEMLLAAGADRVIDVRRFPRSRSNPQFNIETLPADLAAEGISYEHWPDLGGRRPSEGGMDAAINGLWENRSFHAYADYALSAPFQQALAALIGLAETQTPALMCSEAVWWRCHRRIIADHLLARQMAVFHIMETGKIVPASLTPGASVSRDLLVRYPRPRA